MMIVFVNFVYDSNFLIWVIVVFVISIFLK